MRVRYKSKGLWRFIKVQKLVKKYCDPVRLKGVKDVWFCHPNKVCYLKIFPEFYAAVTDSDKSKRKTLEIRLNDRDYHVGDILVLEEYIPAWDKQYSLNIQDEMSKHLSSPQCEFSGEGNKLGMYTGNRAIRLVTHIVSTEPYVDNGYVAMSLLEIR